MPKGEVKKRSYVFLFLRIAVVAAGIIWVASRIGREHEWSSFVQYFHRMNLWVFAATLGIFTIGHMVVALRWWLLLRTQSVYIGFAAAVKLFLLGWFYNNFMPSSVGGDLVRAWYVTRHTDKRLEAALSVFVDRGIGLLSTLVIAVFFYTLFLRAQGSAIAFSKSSGYLDSVAEHKWVLVWVLVIVAAGFCGLSLSGRGRAILKKIWLYIHIRALKIINKLRDSIVMYCSKPLAILAAFGLTVCMQIMVITGFWFLGVSMGITADIRYYFVFFTLTWVLGAIPISIGGAVVVEGSLVILFTQFAGIEEPAAWAIALSQRAVWMLTSLPGAAIHLIGAHLPKDNFFVDYDKSTD